MCSRKCGALAVAMMLLFATDALAQTVSKPRTPPAAPAKRPPLARGYIAVGAAVLIADNDFSTQSTMRVNAEDESRRVRYAVGRETGIDVVAGLPLWRSYGLRVGVGRVSSETPASIDASVPHPFFFGRPRTLSAEASSLDRDELAVNVGVMATLQPHRRLQVSIFAGPTLLRASQEVITGVNYSETYPFDTIGFGSHTTVRRNVTKVALGAGVDVNLFLTRSLGVAAGVDFGRTTADLMIENGRTAVKFGGFKSRAGVVFKLP